MKTRDRRLFTAVAFIAVVMLSPTRNVEACGPWFEPDVFVNTTHPDDPATFAAGNLGILQAGFDSRDYAVAFRYLNGGKLSDAERLSFAPPVSPAAVQEWSNLSPAQAAAAQQAEIAARKSAQPAGHWLEERAKYTPASTSAEQEPSFPTDYEGNIVLDEGYLNCPDPAFANATLTLSKRAHAWGDKSPWLADWIHGQDAVFSNCAGKTATTPAPATPGGPALLQADRAYQVASATFYAKRFDDAAREFAAIAADGKSPWSAWGGYLAARATVRKAFAMGSATDPYSNEIAGFDMDTMKHAQQMLEMLLKQPSPLPSRTIVQDELNFIRIRIEPEQRATEICAALAGPAPDPNFTHDIDDLNWLLLKRTKIGTPPPLLAWIAAWRGGSTAATAYAMWQSKHALPWLVMALAQAQPADPFAPELVDAATTIGPGTPAYDAVFFHRVRLLIGLKRTDEARGLLDAAISALRREKPGSSLNALLGERMAVARRFSEFLTYAPRSTLSVGSQGADDLQGQCNQNAHADNGSADCPELKEPQEFDEDAVTVLNRETPINLLIEAGNSQSLPDNLRHELAISAWTRTVLLEDADDAAKLAPLLPKAIRDAAGSSVGFPADVAILRNPGIRPYLEPGVARVASFGYFDDFRNNWWCKPWDDRPDNGEAGPPQQNPPPLPVPPFMPAGDVARGAAEVQRLQQLPDSIIVIGQRVVDYARQHPEDPLAPEALALTVRAGHYACAAFIPDPAGENGSEYTPVSKAAFELLHRRYPKSPWALKTRYYY
jgi:hypothetical protein